MLKTSTNKTGLYLHHTGSSSPSCCFPEKFPTLDSCILMLSYLILYITLHINSLQVIKAKKAYNSTKIFSPT